MKLVIAKSNIEREAQLRDRQSKIISIFPVSVTESERVHLIAITNGGIRLYFTTNASSQYRRRPSVLALFHIRNALLEDVHVAYSAQGTVLLGYAQQSQRDMILALGHDFRFETMLQQMKLL